MKKKLNQSFKFGMINGIVFSIDYGLMVFITEVFNCNPLISICISFFISEIFNYFTNIKLIIENNKKLIIYILLSLIGLGITELVMYFLDKQFSMNYMISKLISIFILICYKSLTKNLYVINNKRKY